MCMTRMDELPLDESVLIEPMRRFPHMKDLVTDVSWNYEINQRIQPLKPKPREADGTYRMQQEDIERITRIPQMYRMLPLPGCCM